MKKIITFLVLFSSIVNMLAQETVTNRNGKEITVNAPASSTAQGVVKLANDLGGTADAPTVPGLTNKLDGSGTINYIPKFTATKTLGNSLLFDSGTNIGIGTTSPANTLEIKQGTAGNSGLRFTNLNSASTATTSASKVLTLNSSGDVILANVPGTQNIVDFSTTTPTTSGVVFTPNTPADESVVYQSAVDNSMWTYNGTTYVTYAAPASTEWNLANTNNDAGSNKTSGIFRTGNVGIGMNNPTVPLDVQSTLNSLYVSTARFLAPNNTTAGNATLLNFGVAASTGNTADWRYVYQGNGAASNRIDFGMSGYAAPMLSYLNSGNVGVGTTAPAAKLHVQGQTGTTTINADAQVLRFSRPGIPSLKWDNVAQFNLGNYTTAVNANTRLDLALNDGATLTPSTVMTWQANGNVGIGTSSPSGGLTMFGAPTSGLTANILGRTDLSKEIIFGKGGATKGFAAIAAVDQGGYGGGLAFFTKAIGTDNFPNSAIQAMNIDWLGNVGIGNTSPSAPLVVQGKTSGSGVFKLVAPAASPATGDNWWLGFGHGTISTDANDRARIGVEIAGGGPGRLFFTTGAPGSQTRALYIDESQRVGIGTSAPTGQLEVATNNGLSALIRRGGSAAQTPANLILQKTSGVDAATHGALVNGDYVGRILFSASNGSSYLTNGTDIVGYAAGAQSATNNGGGIFFRTVPQNSVGQSVERMRIEHNGNIGIGDFSVTAPVSKLEVNGAATNTTAYNAAAGTTVDFSKSNLAYTTANPGAFTLTNLKDGGTYTLAVQGTTAGTASFSATSFTFKSVNNAATIAGKQTLYTFIVMGTTVYFYMATGF